MFRRIKISYGLIVVLVLLTLIQIISGSPSRTRHWSRSQQRPPGH
ncbi:hypothetical protein FPE53_24215 [Salmonella enterica subsp. enterica]|uniref:Uncharacterized protein n=2 Tax=Salmonella enterica TaxID=28901 RepID=A0A744KFS1_SALER|nr:hypothetical protein [Salmonella enterica subsp. enterica serovar Aqua]ECH1172294.1 hypothetical protein [Salmonella enterica subsp. enterica serovar Aqua]HAF2609387.1 hypothetical protein [Salmonella enterica]